MNESATRRPCHLPEDLDHDFRAIGICPGMTVISHCSLRSIGMLIGGIRIYVESLLRVLGPEGTLVMPAHSAELSDPSYWQNPPVPASEYSRIREQMPAFEKHLTPSWNIGLVAEFFRNYPQVKRSYHPKDSFCAIGKHSDFILDDHSLDHGLGEKSPLGKIYELGGHILLAGAGMDGNTSLHLAEHRAKYKMKRYYREGSPVMKDGQRTWIEYDELVTDAEQFSVCKKGLSSGAIVHTAGHIGNAYSYLIDQRSCVDYFVKLLEEELVYPVKDK